MKVYIVWCDYQTKGNGLVDIFETKEKAEMFIKTGVCGYKQEKLFIEERDVL